MGATQEIVAVVGMNARALTSRIAASLVVITGMAAAVAVALSIFSMAAGVSTNSKTVSVSGQMVIISQGADNEGTSNIPRDAIPIIADTPGIKRGPDGKPLISAEINARFFARKKVNSIETFVNVRGVESNVFAIKTDMRLVEGRMFTPGLHELIVGKGASVRFENVGVGEQIRLQDGPWTVVGMFESATGVSDYGLLGDADTLMATMRRNTFNMVVVNLESGTNAAEEQFAAALKSNPTITVDVETERHYRLRAVKEYVQFYAFLAYGVGAIMGLGVIFAALNTMYVAVSARAGEIATLRAIGFGCTAVVLSIFFEAFALTVLGAVIGGTIAWTVFNGHHQEMGFLSIVQAVTPEMMAAGIALSLVVGAIGALFPAIRAARLPVATALRNLRR